MSTNTIITKDGTQIFYKDWERISPSSSATASRSIPTPRMTRRSSWPPGAIAPSPMTVAMVDGPASLGWTILPLLLLDTVIGIVGGGYWWIGKFLFVFNYQREKI
ncbi:MAG TPA: hypothetical protein VGN34_16355 [Ktedonobacteraceae bacterium]